MEDIGKCRREAGEAPDTENCPEALIGERGRKLEIDAFAFDDADESVHLFSAVWDGAKQTPPAISLTEARDLGFNRLIGVFDQSRSGWLTDGNIEESRPLWALAKQIRERSAPAALRLHVLTDRFLSERVREIPAGMTREGILITFQIWDVARLKRIQDARNARDDLVVDFRDLSGGGLPVLRAAVGDVGYDAYLAVVPAEALADVYLRYGSRLLEGNVRTFLGRRGNVNKGISATIEKEASRFFAYNNGIAATASAVEVNRGPDGSLTLVSATDLQIVNGAQTTASLAAARRAKKLSLTHVFVPMKLSVVTSELAAQMIPLISRYANSQNSVRASDFFANHPFHRRIEEISRRVLAPAVKGSQVQTRWYHERARGQHQNDQVGLTAAKREQFLRMNPRSQLITKTDLAKIENCFALFPDIACKGAEKSFVEFAERITEEWETDSAREGYGDDWFKSAAARMILFQVAEKLVSDAQWYEKGYRSQIVAYTLAKLSKLSVDKSKGGGLDFRKIWGAQSAGEVLERQILAIAEAMAGVLRTPPLAGQNIGEWAKQQACRKRALETEVPVIRGFSTFLIDADEVNATRKPDASRSKVDSGLKACEAVIGYGPTFWQSVREYARKKRLTLPDDEKALAPAITSKIPTDAQAERLIRLLERCKDSGFGADIAS